MHGTDSDGDKSLNMILQFDKHGLQNSFAILRPRPLLKNHLGPSQPHCALLNRAPNLRCQIWFSFSTPHLPKDAAFCRKLAICFYSVSTEKRENNSTTPLLLLLFRLAPFSRRQRLQIPPLPSTSVWDSAVVIIVLAASGQN